MTREELNKYLYTLINYEGSDLHIKAGEGVRFRIHGELHKVESPKLTRESVVNLLKELLRSRFEEMVKNKEIDFSYKLDENYRFRANAFFQVDGPSIVFRVIPLKIPTLDELDFPNVIRKFTEIERGLVLVTGVTGSGKSTTLAALINEINEKKAKHIITIEDPVEFIHKDKKSLINQRSLGEDTRSFTTALRAALREDPDIILVGEMRDRETIEIALHAAETGHLVFSTLHTLDAKETINRIIGVFPIDEQQRIRLVLSSVLQGIISQRLVPTVNKKRTAAMEVLISTPRIQDMILKNRDKEIKDALEEGKLIYGTQSFDQHLVDLVLSGKINEDTALKFATSKDDLKLKLKQEKMKVGKDTKTTAIPLKD
ncbi:type IV pilus twitching motility protein PilT [Caminibacter mediatlanticus TB-2]|uniref:Type IV pilus twitching motility protein PilT n=1 Tax=Caminibacter mediatlanticus TB-2 TaxID=391592 RepID=A0ABX5VCR6_9BACT|nr:type IV pilus twitching motility protein PilT [Caminibacter mediatlanticus]QCT94466.1 type IV pilus twitching motility protein PilT [Caminibacter mediatlanticus TB-2]